jgi:hypothetical protein
MDTFMVVRFSANNGQVATDLSESGEKFNLSASWPPPPKAKVLGGVVTQVYMAEPIPSRPM